jgi:hypothetical protein
VALTGISDFYEALLALPSIQDITLDRNINSLKEYSILLS